LWNRNCKVHVVVAGNTANGRSHWPAGCVGRNSNRNLGVTPACYGCVCAVEGDCAGALGSSESAAVNLRLRALHACAWRNAAHHWIGQAKEDILVATDAVHCDFYRAAGCAARYRGNDLRIAPACDGSGIPAVETHRTRSCAKTGTGDRDLRAV